MHKELLSRMDLLWLKLSVVLVTVLLQTECSPLSVRDADDAGMQDGTDADDLPQDISQEMGVSKVVFKTVNLPKHFANYDLSRDGLIALEELVQVTGVDDNAEKVFYDSDKNGR